MFSVLDPQHYSLSYIFTFLSKILLFVIPYLHKNALIKLYSSPLFIHFSTNRGTGQKWIFCKISGYFEKISGYLEKVDILNIVDILNKVYILKIVVILNIDYIV
jgi:hypothetical protein